jgi:FkbM family methyltransferase
LKRPKKRLHRNVGERPLKSVSKIEVTAVALKKVIFSIACVSLLNVDCEGAEYDILGSLQKSDVANVMQISMETHRTEGREERELLAMVADLGFKVFGD